MDWVTTGRYNKYMANQWFKFYGGEYLSDSKIGRLTDSERSCWLTLLCMASMTDDGIIKFLSIDDLLTKSGIKWDPYNEGAWEKCQGVLTKLSGMKMIKVDTDQSSIEITNWDKRQERTAQTPYERVKKHRENKVKIENDNENETVITKMITTEENRIEENRIDIKSIYSEFKNVKLTNDEFLKLTERIGEKNTNIIIEELGGYIASTNKRYASHYATLLNWARRKYQDNSKTLSSKRKIA